MVGVGRVTFADGSNPGAPGRGVAVLVAAMAGAAPNAVTAAANNVAANKATVPIRHRLRNVRMRRRRVSPPVLFMGGSVWRADTGDADRARCSPTGHISSWTPGLDSGVHAENPPSRGARDARLVRCW